nr:PocR ligand-binding domain-containing protein [Candidatus Delongbacteria bacterium]
MKYELKNLIDVAEVDVLLSNFNKATGFVTAVLDLEGNILSKSGWRKICTEFHRKNPESEKNCVLSDTILSRDLNVSKQYSVYKCFNGLVDVAMPILLNGEHIGNIFTGQFFFKAPEKEYFLKQAEKYGFEKESYIDVMEKVPVVNEDHVKNVMTFLLKMTEFISHMAIIKNEQKELIEELRKSEEKYRLFIETSDDIIYTITPEGILTFVSPAWTKLLGHTLEEVVGKPFEPFLHPDDLPGCLYLLQNINNPDLKQNTVDYRVKHLNGSWRWHSSKATILNGSNGEFIGFMGIARDITEKMLVEKDLKKSEKRYHDLLVNLETGIVVHAPDTSIIMNNDKASELLGLTDVQMKGKEAIDPAWKFVDEDNKPLNLDTYPVNRIAKNRQPIKNQTLGICHSGISKITWVTVNGFPVLDSTGKTTEIVISFIDITEKNKAEEELSHYKEHLENLVQERTKELEEKNEKLSKYNKLFVDREFRVKELKDKIKELEL